MDLDRARKNWLTHGAIGSVLFISGSMAALDGIYRRVMEFHWEVWALELGLGLAVTFSGLVVLGSAVRYLVHMDRIAEYADRRARKRTRKSQNEMEANQALSSGRPGKSIRLEPVRMEAH